MSKSLKRVRSALELAGLDAAIVEMAQSTRTAEDAATACDCSVDQIVKSMVFEGTTSGALKLLLVSGVHTTDQLDVAGAVGETLTRADPKRVRAETGFAIGGVAPIGHLAPIDVWMDDHLLAFPVVWAAAGTPAAVFPIDPATLKSLTEAASLPRA